MRRRKVKDEALYRQLAELFRRRGYDGVSYGDVMKSTGLVKASLYHRFPGGKDEMVDAVLTATERKFGEYVLAPLSLPGDPARRVRLTARRIGEFYRSGAEWCLLDTLTLAKSVATLAHARRMMEAWVGAFTQVARDAGLPSVVARRRAEDAVAGIEGALIVSRVLGTRRAFQRVLAGLPAQLTLKREGEERRSE